MYMYLWMRKALDRSILINEMKVIKSLSLKVDMKSLKTIPIYNSPRFQTLNLEPW